MGEAARSLHEDFQIDERAALRAVIHANVDLYSEHNFWTGLTMNMSEGGVFVATYHALPVGAMLLLQLRLPFEEHAMVMLVQVRWTRGYSAQDDVPPGLGLQFIDADACSLAKIRSFVATMREPLFFDIDD
jgi:uncharacterized protein (TIGR02266 family)